MIRKYVRPNGQSNGTPATVIPRPFPIPKIEARETPPPVAPPTVPQEAPERSPYSGDVASLFGNPEYGRLELHFGVERVQLDYASSLKIDDLNLDNELKQQPSLYAYYARLLAMQKAITDAAKNALKEYEGRLYSVRKQQLIHSGTGKPTQADIEASMNRDLGLHTRRQDLLEKQLQLDILWAVRDSLLQKKDSLMTLSANRRMEWNTDLFVKRREEFENGRKGGGK